jgi:heme/copper-type cytochrome/quinol oxidase subunit 2
MRLYRKRIKGEDTPEWKDLDIVEQVLVVITIIAIVAIGLYVARVLLGPTLD